MPTLRVMADGRPIMATGGMHDNYSIPAYKVPGGSTIKLTIDYTAYLGSDTFYSGNWACDGATLGTATQTGGVVTTLIALPNVLVGRSVDDLPYVPVVHRLTTTEGRILNMPVKLWVQPASGTDLFVLAGIYLA